LNCHCSDRRRATGAAFKSFVGIARDELRIAPGENELLIFGEEDAAVPREVTRGRIGPDERV